jgi:hypothetical protein
MCKDKKIDDRYDKANALSKIDGYFVPRPEERWCNKLKTAFERSKAETISQMEKALMDVENCTFSEFVSHKQKQGYLTDTVISEQN